MCKNSLLHILNEKVQADLEQREFENTQKILGQEYKNSPLKKH